MGVDLGTSSVKTVLIDQEGRLLSCAIHEYPIETPHPGWGGTGYGGLASGCCRDDGTGLS